MNPQRLSPNDLSVIGLANEYCQAMELAASTTPNEFIARILRLLPRIYIAVTDITYPAIDEPEYMFDSAHLDEAYYDQVRQNIAALLGSDDAYLETSHEDMQYSDSPLAASIAEGLADIFQVLYNFIEDVKHADTDTQIEQLAQLHEEFTNYWSAILCNVMRPLNLLSHKDFSEEDEY